MSTRWRRESGVCTGRGFSNVDAEGYESKLMTWVLSPNTPGTPAAYTVDYTTDIFTLNTHGFVTGQAIEFVNVSGAAPSPLVVTSSPKVRYFVIYIDPNTFYVAATHHDAIINNPIDILDNGTGTNTVFYSGGGAEHYLMDDFSHMVNHDFATTDVNIGTNEITVTTHGYPNYLRVVFSSTGGLPSPLVAGTTYWIRTSDANTFKVYQYEGYAIDDLYAIDLTTQGTGTHTITPMEHYIIVCDVEAPVVNDYNTGPTGLPPKFFKLGFVDSEAGYVRMQSLLWWDTSTHTPYGYWMGNRISTYDSAEFVYDFHGGDGGLFLFSQLGATWYRIYVDEWEGISSLLESTAKVGVLQSGITAGSNVVLTMATAGQAANFTVGKFYYLYDYSGHTWVNYVRVTDRDLGLNTVTINICYKNFPTGSVLCAYAHRFYSYGQWYLPDHLMDGYQSYSGAGVQVRIPYCSSKQAPSGSSSYVHFNQNSYIPGPAVTLQYDDSALSVNPPDDEGNYYAIRYRIAESFDSFGFSYTPVDMNRIYGKSTHIIRTYRGAMGQMSNFRTMNSKDWLYISLNTDVNGDCVLHTESAV